MLVLEQKGCAKIVKLFLMKCVRGRTLTGSLCFTKGFGFHMVLWLDASWWEDAKLEETEMRTSQERLALLRAEKLGGLCGASL